MKKICAAWLVMLWLGCSMIAADYAIKKNYPALIVAGCFLIGPAVVTAYFLDIMMERPQ